MPSLSDLRAKLKDLVHRRDTVPSARRECLWATPETCHSIIAKKERGELLTREEWKVFTHYVQQGSEYPRWRTTSQPALLRAFRAAFEIRDHRRSNGMHLAYYLGNLPAQIPRYKATAEGVREAIAATFEELACHPDAYLWPLLPGRNLHVVLDYEPLIGGIETLNAALLPHWDALYPVAALQAQTIQELKR